VVEQYTELRASLELPLDGGFAGLVRRTVTQMARTAACIKQNLSVQHPSYSRYNLIGGARVDSLESPSLARSFGLVLAGTRPAACYARPPLEAVTQVQLEDSFDARWRSAWL